MISFHFQQAPIPVFHSSAMAVSGTGSLVFGKVFDRFGIGVLIPLTVISALATPLVLGSSSAELIGTALWDLGMGVHESTVPAAVATMVPVSQRPSAYGLFTETYGIFLVPGERRYRCPR